MFKRLYHHLPPMPPFEFVHEGGPPYRIHIIYESTFGTDFLIEGIEGMPYVGNIDQYHGAILDAKESEVFDERKIERSPVREPFSRHSPRSAPSRSPVRITYT